MSSIPASRPTQVRLLRSCLDRGPTRPGSIAALTAQPRQLAGPTTRWHDRRPVLRCGPVPVDPVAAWPSGERTEPASKSGSGPRWHPSPRWKDASSADTRRTAIAWSTRARIQIPARAVQARTRPGHRWRRMADLRGVPPAQGHLHDRRAADPRRLTFAGVRPQAQPSPQRRRVVQERRSRHPAESSLHRPSGVEQAAQGRGAARPRRRGAGPMPPSCAGTTAASGSGPTSRSTSR